MDEFRSVVEPGFDGLWIGQIALAEFVDPTVGVVVQQHRGGRRSAAIGVSINSDESD